MIKNKKKKCNIIYFSVSESSNFIKCKMEVLKKKKKKKEWWEGMMLQMFISCVFSCQIHINICVFSWSNMYLSNLWCMLILSYWIWKKFPLIIHDFLWLSYIAKCITLWEILKSNLPYADIFMAFLGKIVTWLCQSLWIVR